MDRRFLTVLGLSLVFALVVSSIFYYQFTARAAGPGRTRMEMKDVVVATKPLSVGVTIKPDDVRLTKIPAEGFPKGAFSKIEDVLERPVVGAILHDEPVLEGRLAQRGSGLGLAPVIPVGMRAVSVRVTDVAGVAGFVLPGLRVDVLVTGKPPDARGSITTTCLQNIQVLSAGQTIQPDARGQAINTPIVTLLVTPEQAEILTLAGNEGRIQLVLRNSTDQQIAKTPGREVYSLYGAAAKPAPAAPAAAAPARPKPRPPVSVAVRAAPPAPAAPPAVIVIRGTQRTEEPVAVRTN